MQQLNNNYTQYNPDFFAPLDLDHAKNIILTPEDIGTEQRWETETVWALKVIDSFMKIDSNSTILDWGCGIGRISKILIEKYNCRVIGIDLQPKMLEYATSYVNSDLFSTLQYSDILYTMPKDKFTHGIASWVFQHSNKVQIEIPLIFQSMKANSQLFVLESDKKAIPNLANSYYDDGIPTRRMLEKFFDAEILGKIPSHVTSKRIRDMSWFGILSKKKI